MKLFCLDTWAQFYKACKHKKIAKHRKPLLEKKCYQPKYHIFTNAMTGVQLISCLANKFESRFSAKRFMKLSPQQVLHRVETATYTKTKFMENVH